MDWPTEKYYENNGFYKMEPMTKYRKFLLTEAKLSYQRTLHWTTMSHRRIRSGHTELSKWTIIRLFNKIRYLKTIYKYLTL